MQYAKHYSRKVYYIHSGIYVSFMFLAIRVRRNIVGFSNVCILLRNISHAILGHAKGGVFFVWSSCA